MDNPVLNGEVVMLCGIYVIKNILNGKIYVGSSVDIDKRWVRHKRELRKGQHHNKHLQSAYTKYGVENFTYDVIHECSPENLLKMETFFVAALNSCDNTLGYNIGSIGGGDNITNHPDRDIIVENLTKHLTDYRDGLSEQERKGIYGFPMETNPNWRGGVSVTYCDCGQPKSYSAKACMSCVDRSGNKNSFYGKSHSEETRKKLSEKLAGRLPPNCMRVQIDNICFRSASEAAKHLGVCTRTVLNRIKNPKFENYNFC